MSILKQSLQSGINLGGWISQYPTFDYHYFETFITADDIRRICDWGCDHVRLPVDYPVLEDDIGSGVPNERGLGYVERCLDWCQQSGLQVILDLHKAVGFSFNNLQAATLFENPLQQEYFLDLWQALAERFKATTSFVAFELLNEIVLPDSAPWNRLLQQAVRRIHDVDSERLIVVGGNYYNSASELTNLELLDDPNILYTFHFYEPMVVTHQKATWVPSLFDYNHAVDYPGSAGGLDGFLVSNPQYKPALARYAGKYLDRSILMAYVQPAVDFMKNNGQVVYCGEYGVIDAASMQTRINWTRDFISILRENNIGRAAWSYKAMDFGLVDTAGKVVNAELVKIICERR
ncbi:MAG: glycoside hydrolase family 5 protein [Anaerolineales bacterium]